jgi:hypothetical protein
MIAAYQIAFGKATGKGLSAKDYIQDGLVAMWDGIENAGWGVHDPSATVWKDLVGDCDLFIPSAGAWTDDAYVSGGFARGPSRKYGADGAITIEAVWSVDLLNSFSAFKCQEGTGGRTASGVSMYVYNFASNAPYPTLRASFANADRGWFYSGISDTAPVLGVRFHQAVVNPGSGITLANFINGVKGVPATAYPLSYVDNHSAEVCLFGYSNTTGRCQGNCLRIYSRALTAEEIAHNYEIDKARFGL